MLVNTYAVLSDCVEAGVAYGVRRAFKHTDTPSQEAIAEEVEQAVLNAICEKFTFPDVYP